MTDAEKQIREALAAGPTPGEWFSVNDGTRGEPFMNVKAERISGRGPTHEVAICATGDSPQSMETANARYIAACHPAAIRELLAEIERLRAERAALQLAVDAARILLAKRDALKADAERLASLAWPEPFCDEYNGIDLHEQASIYASALGREEPNRDDYLAALRCAIDAARGQA